jgi:hypothetical protein
LERSEERVIRDAVDADDVIDLVAVAGLCRKRASECEGIVSALDAAALRAFTAALRPPAPGSLAGVASC